MTGQDELAYRLAADLVCHSMYFKLKLFDQFYRFQTDKVGTDETGPTNTYYSLALGNIYVTNLKLFIPKDSYFAETYAYRGERTEYLKEIVVMDKLPDTK